jgi:hypothetical protein
MRSFTLKVSLAVMLMAFALPNLSKAITYQELLNNQNSDQSRVLGAVSPSPDINGDGIVNSFDVVALVSHLGENYPSADLNNDGIVNSVDYSILSSWWFAKR